MSHALRSALLVTSVAVGASAARGQDVVPGGWTSEVRVQSFGAPSGGFGLWGWYGYGPSAGSYGGLSSPGMGSTFAVPANPPGVWPSAPGTSNGLIPLGHVVRRSVRRRGR